MKSDTLLTRNECSALRGIAILGIVLHNFCHWLRPIVKENEYLFHQANVDGINNALLHPTNLLTMHLLSFFGHYGVPIFLFLSAYGLVLKYEKADSDVQPLPFVRYHFLKLFKMMLTGFVIFLLVDYVTPHPHHYKFIDVAAQMLMLNNLLPNPDAVIWPGPYWFFGLMLQLYIVFRLLLYRRDWKLTVGLMILCTAVQLVCAPESETLNRLRYNCVGGLLPFGAGLLCARYCSAIPKRKALYAVLTLLSCVLVWLLSQHYWAWYAAPLAVCLAAILFVKSLTPSLLKPFDALGKISAALFIIHPVTRKILIPIARRGDYYTGLLLYIIASLALAWLVNELMKKIPNPTLKR